MKPKHSHGFDEISMKLIKTTKFTLIEPITILINQMLNTCIFPDLAKIAKVVPVYKKDDETPQA